MGAGIGHMLVVIEAVCDVGSGVDFDKPTAYISYQSKSSRVTGTRA